jgi:hypothetical protein
VIAAVAGLSTFWGVAVTVALLAAWLWVMRRWGPSNKMVPVTVQEVVAAVEAGAWPCQPHVQCRHGSVAVIEIKEAAPPSPETGYSSKDPLGIRLQVTKNRWHKVTGVRPVRCGRLAVLRHTPRRVHPVLLQCRRRRATRSPNHWLWVVLSAVVASLLSSNRFADPWKDLQ